MKAETKSGIAMIALAVICVVAVAWSRPAAAGIVMDLTQEDLPAAEAWMQSIIPTGADTDDILTKELAPVECLALNMYHEARGEGEIGMGLVATVTVSRKKSPCYRPTVCGVVRAHRQFSWTTDGKWDHATDEKAYAEAYRLAVAWLFLKARVNLEGVDERLLNFHTVDVNPKWENVQVVLVWRRHIFYIQTGYRADKCYVA